MIRPILPVVAAAMAATPAAAEVAVQSSGPVIALSVSESVSLDPDIANVSAGVTTVAPTAVEAMEQNNVQMERVIEAIEAQGIDEDDIQTSGVNLNAEYDYDQGTRQQVFRGYRVSNRVTVKVRDIPRTGRVLDALVRSGANEIGGIGWTVDDPAPAHDQARGTAFRTAHARAMEYARMAGYSSVRLIEISEAFSQSRPMPMMDQAIAVTATRNESMPIRPGQVQTGVTVNFSFEMVQ